MVYLIKVNMSWAVLLCDISRREKDGTQPITAQKWSFPLKFSRKLRIWSHLLMKYLMEKFSELFVKVNYFLYGVFGQVWYEFQLKYWHLRFGFRKIEVPDSVSRDLWCYQNWHVAIENSESKKFLNSAWHFFLKWILSRSFRLVKGNISFYERKKNTNFARKEKFISWILRIKETLLLWISISKNRSFSTQEVGRKIFP